MPDEQTPAADWYPDPEHDDMLRYWDGSAWTDHRHPRGVDAAEADESAAPEETPPEIECTLKWRRAKADRIYARVVAALPSHEVVLYLGTCNNVKPWCNLFVLSESRLLALQDLDKNPIKFSALYEEIGQVTTDEAKGTVEVELADGREVVFKQVPDIDMSDVLRHFQEQGVAASARGRVTPSARDADARGPDWPNTNVRGKLSQKASQAISRQCHGDDEPWLILTPGGGAGTLAAFDDRLAIIKTGALTSLMAGSLGGERSATFHFTDITGIEYNSGLLSGVLEILTPSYNGTANRDYWRGSNKSRNADVDPWTLSNCLPLNKAEYESCLNEINELKSRISKSKQVRVEVVSSGPVDGLAEQLQKLADLHTSGVLSDEEFAAAKQRLLSG